MMNGSNLLMVSALISVGVMTGLWLVQLKTKNAGVVDIGWSGLVPTLAVLAAFTSCPWTLREILPSCLAVLWGGRLVWHIHRRNHGKPEDSRYADLRKRWQPSLQWKFFIFFQFQAAAALLFALPYWLIIRDPPSNLLGMEWIGLGLAAAAWAGEATADRQLKSFVRDPANKGKVCDRGLWRYSRHPNYFFEWMIWVCLALAAWPGPYGWVAILCPVLMLFFLFKVTGIPAAEASSLRSKGDAYRAYMARTSVFVPLPPRSSST